MQNKLGRYDTDIFYQFWETIRHFMLNTFEKN